MSDDARWVDLTLAGQHGLRAVGAAGRVPAAASGAAADAGSSENPNPMSRTWAISDPWQRGLAIVSPPTVAAAPAAVDAAWGARPRTALVLSSCGPGDLWVQECSTARLPPQRRAEVAMERAEQARERGLKSTVQCHCMEW